MPVPVAIACHDAGGANVVAALVVRHPEGVQAYVEGPARRIWAETVPAMPQGSLLEAMTGARSLLTSTSVGSTLEHDARKLAKIRGMRSVAVLDHWTRYRERFEMAGELVLPDEIWVVDEPAEQEVRRRLPPVSIRRVPNYYLDGQVREIEALGPVPPRPDAQRILYVLEPIEPQWFTDDPRPRELQAFDFFVSHLDELGARPEAEIVLRPHPSDPPGKYDGWRSLYPRRQISVNGISSLSTQIAWADWVAGCETFALVIANRAGRVTMSTLPPWAPECRLPLPGLQHLSKKFPEAVRP